MHISCGFPATFRLGEWRSLNPWICMQVYHFPSLEGKWDNRGISLCPHGNIFIYLEIHVNGSVGGLLGRPFMSGNKQGRVVVFQEIP